MTEMADLGGPLERVFSYTLLCSVQVPLLSRVVVAYNVFIELHGCNNRK